MSKPGSSGQAAEHAGQPEEEDRRREHSGDRRARHAEQLVARRGASVRRSSRHSCTQRALSRPSSACGEARGARARSPNRVTIAERPQPAPLSMSSAEKLEIIGSRTPLTMKLAGLYSAIVFAGSCSRSSGKNAVERKRITKTSGNIPCTTLALPVRSAIAAPIEPKATAEPTTKRDRSRGPRQALLDPDAEDVADHQEPDRREERRAQRSRPAGPGRSRNARSALRSRRSVKPISMSTASAMPPLFPASSVDWTIAPASMKARKLWTGGKPGRSTARPAPPVWIASSSVGKISSGASSCGRRKVC